MKLAATENRKVKSESEEMVVTNNMDYKTGNCNENKRIHLES